MEMAIGCYVVPTYAQGSSSELLLYFIFMVYFYSSNQINDMGRERKYVGPQGFWQEGRFSVFATYIGQTCIGINGLTGINIPLPPPSCSNVLVVPKRCWMPKKGTEDG